MHRSLRIAALSVFLGACHGASTAPDPAGCHAASLSAPPAARPAGNGVSRVAGLVGRPFGVRVSSAGDVFLTEQDANAVARVSLSTFAAAPSVGVGADPGDVVLSRDGRTAFVSTYYGGTVDVIDVAGGRRTRSIAISPVNAYRLALSPDDQRIYVTTTTGLLFATDASTPGVTMSVALGGALQGIALTRDGGGLYVSNTQGKVWKLNACTLVATDSIQVPAAAQQELVLSPDERELFLAGEAGVIDVLDAATLAPRRRFSLATLSPFGMAITGDGTRLYVASPSNGTLAVLDAGTGSVLQTLAVGGTPRRVAFDASGTVAVVSNEWNWVDVIR